MKNQRKIGPPLRKSILAEEFLDFLIGLGEFVFTEFHQGWGNRVNSGYFKAFALTGRLDCVLYYPGRCPGLGASALSGRVKLNVRASGARLL